MGNNEGVVTFKRVVYTEIRQMSQKLNLWECMYVFMCGGGDDITTLFFKIKKHILTV
jgi:hypothetical protein